MFVNIQHIQQWQQKFNSWSGRGWQIHMTTVMTGSDLKKLTEGELGIGAGGGANSEYLSVILRGIQRKKADGREGEGVKEPITFLTKRPKGVPMFCVIDSNVIKNKMSWLNFNVMSSECESMRKSRRGGGSEPPLGFPVWLFDGRQVGEGRVVTDSGKEENEKKKSLQRKHGIGWK